MPCAGERAQCAISAESATQSYEASLGIWGTRAVRGSIFIRTNILLCGALSYFLDLCHFRIQLQTIQRFVWWAVVMDEGLPTFS